MEGFSPDADTSAPRLDVEPGELVHPGTGGDRLAKQCEADDAVIASGDERVATSFKPVGVEETVAESVGGAEGDFPIATELVKVGVEKRCDEALILLGAFVQLDTHLGVLRHAAQRIRCSAAAPRPRAGA